MNRHLEDPHVIECEEDLKWLFEHVSEQPRFECGWCCRRSRSKSLKLALKWFHEHGCIAHHSQ